MLLQGSLYLDVKEHECVPGVPRADDPYRYVSYVINVPQGFQSHVADEVGLAE